MKFIITGSGGCVCTPKPLCQCPVCMQARQKGYPYARCGCSLYLEEIALLVDTPEDISIALNNADIRVVDHILYSHWDPDHTLGMRVMEQLRLEWLDYYENIRPNHPVKVYAASGVMEDLLQIRNKDGAYLSYYESMGLIELLTTDLPLLIGNIKITMMPVAKDKAVSVFLFESNGKKLIYAPCDCIPFPESDSFDDADVLVIGNTYIGEILKGGRRIAKEHPLHSELYSIDDILAIQSRYRIGEVVITHIEEDWGKSLDDYRMLEKQYEHLRFAYDNMVIEL